MLTSGSPGGNEVDVVHVQDAIQLRATMMNKFKLSMHCKSPATKASGEVLG